MQQSPQPPWGPPQQPLPQQPPTVPPGNRRNLVIIAAIVGLCVVCSVVGALMPQPQPAAQTTAAAPRTEAPDASAAPAATTAAAPDGAVAAAAGDASTAPQEPPWPEGAHHIREAFRLGCCTYTVVEMSAATRVGDRYLHEDASEGAEFIIVRYTERNDANSTVTAFGSNITLRDHAGRTFQPSTRAQILLGTDMVPELQPGVTNTHRAAFEVPVDGMMVGGIVQPFDLIFAERDALVPDTARVHFRPRTPAPSEESAAPSGRSRRRR